MCATAVRSSVRMPASVRSRVADVFGAAGGGVGLSESWDAADAGDAADVLPPLCAAGERVRRKERSGDSGAVSSGGMADSSGLHGRGSIRLDAGRVASSGRGTMAGGGGRVDGRPAEAAGSLYAGGRSEAEAGSGI